MISVVTNNSYIKNATEVAIPFSGMTRGNVLTIQRGPGTGYMVSSYMTKNSYYLCYDAMVSFGNGNISIGCTANTWGLTTIPVRVDANSIRWR